MAFQFGEIQVINISNE